MGLLFPTGILCSPLPLISWRTFLLLVKAAPPSKWVPSVYKQSEPILELAKGYTPVSTSNSTKWALKVLEFWNQTRNRHHPKDPVPEDLHQLSSGYTCLDVSATHKHVLSQPQYKPIAICRHSTLHCAAHKKAILRTWFLQWEHLFMELKCFGNRDFGNSRFRNSKFGNSCF